MRRDDGCGERDSRNVEGQQGHDAGGTIDADGLRPPIESRAATSRMTATACEDRHPASGCVPSAWGPIGRGVSGGSLCGDWLFRQAGCPGTTCRSNRFAWLAVMLVFEYDRECSPPRCCGGQETGQAFECTAFGLPKAVHSERLGEKMREHSAWGSSSGEKQGRSYGAPVFCRQIPFLGIAAEIRRGAAGEIWLLSGGVAAAVIGRVAACELLPEPEQSRHLGRSLGTASELDFGEAASRLKGGWGLSRVVGGDRRSEKRRHADTADRTTGLQGRRHRDPGGMADVAASGRFPGGGMRSGPSESARTARSGFHRGPSPSFLSGSVSR